MPLLKLIGEGALSGLYNVEELHIADNRMLNDIDTKALTRKDEDSNNEIWPPLRKVSQDMHKKYFQSMTPLSLSSVPVSPVTRYIERLFHRSTFKTTNWRI